MNQDEWAQQVLDQLQVALDDDLLTKDEMRAITDILKPAAERARHGDPDPVGNRTT